MLAMLTVFDYCPCDATVWRPLQDLRGIGNDIQFIRIIRRN
jgi:hypothetical protein